MSPADLLSTRLAMDAALSVLVEGSLLLGATWALAALLGRHGSAARHTVWTTGFALALLVPAGDVLFPGRSVGVLPYAGGGATPGRQASPGLPPATPFPRLPARYGAAGDALGAHATSAEGQTGAWSRRTPGPRAGPGADGTGPGGAAWLGSALVLTFLVVWGLGVLAFLARLVGHRVRVGRLTRRGAPVPAGDAPARLVSHEARRMGIRRRIRVVYTQELPVPVTWGAIRPVLLLPPDAPTWDAARLRAVTVHELAHIRRWDALGQQLAELARAFYWANPLVWVAGRLAAREREGACDDEVLLGGMAPPEYAGVLMDMARRAGAATPALRRELEGGLALAGPSRLEARVAAVLDGAPDRRPSGRRATVASCLALVGVAAALSGMSLAGTPLAIDAPGPRPDIPPPAVRIEAVRALGAECDEVSLWALARALQADPAAEVRRAATRSLTTHDDPRSVDVLAHAASDGLQDPSVRRASLRALGGRDSREAGEALVARLGEDDPILRRAAVRAMGRMDRQAVRVREPVARTMLGDGDPSVRAAAARALRRVGSDESVRWLREALKDPCARVVRMARRTLEHLGAT